MAAGAALKMETTADGGRSVGRGTYDGKAGS